MAVFTTLALVSLLSTLASTFIGAKAGSDANKKRQSLINQSLLNSDNFDKKANKRNLETIENLNEDPREDRRQKFQDDNQEVLDRALNTDRDELIGGDTANVVGKVSDAFKTGRAARTEKVLENSLDLARRAAKVQSVGQGQNKNREINTEGRVEVGGINRQKKGQKRVDQILINSVKPSSKALLFSKILEGVGLAASAGSAFAGGAGAVAQPTTRIAGGNQALLPPTRTNLLSLGATPTKNIAGGDLSLLPR